MKVTLNTARTSRKEFEPIKCQCWPNIETSQMICCANQLTGFYMGATLAFNGLTILSFTVPFFDKRIKLLDNIRNLNENMLKQNGKLLVQTFIFGNRKFLKFDNTEISNSTIWQFNSFMVHLRRMTYFVLL